MCFKVKVKPASVMGDNIALHGLLPLNELPRALRGRIPSDEVWVRKDVYARQKRRKQVLGHERRELRLMTQGMPYKPAHRSAK
jgi:hypothetical protein